MYRIILNLILKEKFPFYLIFQIYFASALIYSLSKAATVFSRYGENYFFYLLMFCFLSIISVPGVGNKKLR